MTAVFTQNHSLGSKAYTFQKAVVLVMTQDAKNQAALFPALFNSAEEFVVEKLTEKCPTALGIKT